MVDVPLVDKEDNVIGFAEEDNATNILDCITRSSAVFVFNYKGELLLQKRSKKKYRYALHWDCSCAGYVKVNEDYLTTAIKELKEEIGIVLPQSKLQFITKKLVETDKKHFTSLYKTIYNNKFTVNKEEVAETKFFSISQIKEMISSGEKFSPYFLILFDEYLKKEPKSPKVFS